MEHRLRPDCWKTSFGVLLGQIIVSNLTMSLHLEQEWASVRPLIEHLYSTERLTMQQVRDYLCSRGFRVK